MHEPTILIVDDDEGLITAMAIRLRQAGYRVTTCTDSLDALGIARVLQPDVILLDVNMPGYTGPDLQDTLQSLGDIENTPVVYITGDTSEEFKKLSAQLGAFSVIYKPFATEELVNTIEKALEAA